MRVGIIRTDLGRGVYLADLDSHNQYPLASANAGQARTLRYPRDAEFDAILAAHSAGVLITGSNNTATVDNSASTTGTDTGPTKDTDPNDTLLIRTDPGDPFTTITIAAGDTEAVATVSSNLNTQFGIAGIGVTADVVGTNQIRLRGTGPSGYLEIDTDVLSTLNTALGFAAGGVIANGNNVLRIKTESGNPYTVITVTAGIATAKTTIRSDLNSAFTSAGLALTADVVGTNQIRISSTETGPGAYIQIDSTASGSTLNTALGFTAGGSTAQGTSFSGLTAIVKAAIYAGSTLDVSQATIIGSDPAFALLSPDAQADLAADIADLAAPKLYETGDVLLSLSKGVMSKLASASYRPDGARTGYATGRAIVALENNGSTEYSV